MAALKSRRLVIVLLGVIAAATLGVLTFQTVDLWPERHTNGWGPLGSEGTATMGFDSAAPGWSIGIPLCLAKGQQPAVLDGSVSGASTTGSGLRYLGAVVRQGTPTLGFRVIGAVEGFPPPAPFNAYHSEKGFAVTTPCQEGPNPSLSVPYTELDLGIARAPGTNGGGWTGFQVGYDVGWRHHVLTIEGNVVTCGRSVPQDLCGGPVPPG